MKTQTGFSKTYTSMKRVSFVLMVMAFLLTSCSEDFLDRNPKGALTYDTFFQTESHAIEATNAIYAQFRQFDMCAFPWIGLTDIISDDADKGSLPNDAANMLEIDEFTFDATNNIVSAAWQSNYHAIFRANLVIENVPGIDMDETLKARLIGEAKFLRAYCYLRLVQWFGDIPMITTLLSASDYYTQPRVPKEQIYDLIEQDFLDAIASLPEKSEYPSADLGRATKGAARGFLAKLYMVAHDFGAAAAQCDAIIQSGEYTLLTRYSDNFLPVGEHGAESLFEISAVAEQSAVAGPGATPYNMVQGVRGVPNLGWGFNRPSDDLVAEYEAGDPRRQATIIYVGEVLPDGSTIVQDLPGALNPRYNQKAWVPDHPGLQDNGPGNIRLLRYADILLLAAEALNETGNASQAVAYVNQVRARARGTNGFILPDITTLDQNELRELIYHERRVELAMEQHRWFDLARWGRTSTVMMPIKPLFQANKNELLPIPQTEVDLTSGIIVQNPGY